MAMLTVDGMSMALEYLNDCDWPGLDVSKPPPAHVPAFLDWLPFAPIGRWELFDGQARCMSPASPTHGAIQATTIGLIGNQLTANGSDHRVLAVAPIVPHIESDGNLRVPDILVTCTPDKRGQKVVTDPVLIIEILSPSNAARTHANVWTYTSIPSVREILVLQSDKVAAKLFRRDDAGQWSSPAKRITKSGKLVLKSIDLTVPLLAFSAQTWMAPAG